MGANWIRSRAVRRLAACLGLALLGATAGDAGAQQWPTKQIIRVIVPLTAGSATDVLARMIFEQVGRQVGQTVVVENRPGAAQTLGANAVAKAEGDGYTILVNSSSHTVVPSTFTNLPFNVAKDFAAIAPLASIPTVMTVSPAKGYKSAQEFAAAAKAKPGSMTYGSGGVGNSTHFAAERFRLAAQFEGVHVPFKGPVEALTEVLAGRVDFYFSPVPPVISLIQEGKLQGLAVSSAKRSSALPDIPTTVEAGFAGSTYEFWVGAFVPAATPRPIVARLHQEVVKALEVPAIRAQMRKTGADPMPMTPAEFDAYVVKEIELNAALVKAAGIKAN